MKRLFSISLMLLMILGSATAQDAATIIKKAEEVRRGVESSQSEMTMTIVRPRYTRSMSMKSWSKGDDFALILFSVNGSIIYGPANRLVAFIPSLTYSIKENWAIDFIGQSFFVEQNDKFGHQATGVFLRLKWSY